MNMEIKQPMVSVCMISYNHEKFIVKALDSILMQKVDFEYEIVVGEDCSTDNTRKILLQYSEKYPGLFKIILQKSNAGPVQNEYDVFKASSGKYIAVLESDDYWLDEYKLQKQVDFLENNQDYGLIFTDICLVDENNEKLPDEIQKKYKPAQIYEGDVFFLLLKKGCFIYFPTSCFTSQIIHDYLKKEKYKYIQDIFLWLIISSRKKIKYLNHISGAYRRHTGNISSDPDSIVGRKAWHYSLAKGINYGLKSKNLKIKKDDFIYLLKFSIIEIFKRKYVYLKYLYFISICSLITKYYFKKA